MFASGPDQLGVVGDIPPTIRPAVHQDIGIDRPILRKRGIDGLTECQAGLQEMRLGVNVADHTADQGARGAGRVEKCTFDLEGIEHAFNYVYGVCHLL